MKNLNVLLLGTVAFMVAGSSCKEIVESPPAPLSKIDTVFVGGGTFQMGSASGEVDESPVHSVTVNSFYMTKTEVTQKMWREVVEWAKDHGTSSLNPDPSSFKGDELPVDQVSWDDIAIWLQHLNARENVDTTLYRLPTEAEWEFAARGGIGSQGYTYSGSNTIESVAWYGTNSGNKTNIVGSKQANELGIFDLSGNVSEWCIDGYSAYPATPQTNPVGNGAYKVIRGGSWSHVKGDCRSSNRLFEVRAARNYSIGFRFVKPLQ